MPSYLKNVRSLAVIAALVVSALPAAWGQTSGGAPASGTFTINGAQVGLDQDGSTWQTILFFINVSATSENSALVTLMDPEGALFNATCTEANGALSAACQWAGNSLLAYGTERFVVAGLTPTTPVAPFKIQLQSSGGYSFSAIVQHFDAQGNLLSSTALTDPGLLVPDVTASYGAAVDEEPFVDQSIILTNPSTSANIAITLNLYDGQFTAGPRPPLATKQYVLGPLGRVSGLLTEIFPNLICASCANPVAGPALPQGFLSATAAQDFGFAVLRQDIAPNGFIVSTPWTAFPAAPAPAGPSAYLSVDPQPLICQGNYTGTIAASASVPWYVYVHAGAAKYLVMASGPVVSATGDYGTTTVHWLAPGYSFTLEAQAGGLLRTVTLTPPASCSGH